MKHKFARKRRTTSRDYQAFSIMEVLISISVISIAMLGVLGSLAYARKSSSQTFRLTEANALQRRTLEMVLSGGNKGPYKDATTLRNGANEPYNGTWIPLQVFADTTGTNSSNPISRSDFVIDSTSSSVEDMKLFQVMCDHGYDIRVTLTPGASNTYRQDICRVQVDVRWRDTGLWRQITTSAEYRRSSS